VVQGVDAVGGLPAVGQERLSPALRFAVHNDTRIEQARGVIMQRERLDQAAAVELLCLQAQIEGQPIEPSPNASSPAPDADRHPSAARFSLGGRSQIPATGMFGQLVQTATLPEPWVRDTS